MILKTIKSKFIFFTILFIVSSIGIPTLFLLFQFKNNFQQRSETMLKTTVEVVHGGLLATMETSEHRNINGLLAEVGDNEGIDHIRIFDETGTISHSSDTSEIGFLINELDPGHIHNLSDYISKVNLLDERNAYSTTITFDNKPVCQSCHEQGEVVAYMDIDVRLTPAERAFFTGSFHIIFLGVLVVVFLFIGTYVLFNRFINRPLNRFLLALDKVQAGDLDTRLPAGKADEFGVIEGHFNRMVSKISESQEKIDELHFEQLQRADKMVTLGELAAEMAHEINNPTAVIMTRADYILLEAQNNPALLKYENDLDVIVSQIQKVSKITGSILKYSKKLPSDFEAINLLTIIDESVRILEPRIQKKHIQYSKDYKCQYDCECALIMGDPQQIEQMFTNLVNNAIDALDEGGKLNITIKCLSNSDREVTITDDGPGMDSDVRDQIFSPFFTTKSAEKGTGLGLYIVKNICKNHDAEIECTSEPGKGTIFTIIFKK